MSTMAGADPELLDELAREMAGAAQRLRALEARVGARLREAPWAGRDADQLRSGWSGRYGRTLTVAATDLEAAASAVNRNAAEQRQASAAGGGAIGVPAVAGLPPATAGPAGAVGGTGLDGPADGSPPAPGLFDSRTASLTGTGELGALSAEGTISGSLLTGSVKAPEASFTLGGREYEDGAWQQTLAEAKVEAGAQFAVAEVKADGKAELGPAELAAEGSAMVGAKVDGEAGIALEEDKLAASAGVSAMLGATAAAKASAEAFGAKGSIEGHVTAGLELKADVDAEISYQKVKVTLDLAAALGIGGGIKPEFEFEPAEAVKDVLDLFSDE
jgi:hypothetical protein